jgi:hypothetical protein
MTPRNESTPNEFDADAEITPEMLEAGSLAYYASDHDSEVSEVIVERVFRAMSAISQFAKSRVSRNR